MGVLHFLDSRLPAEDLLPGVSELEIEELAVGLRPGTPDNAPVIGSGTLGGLVWATGHHRNGILLAPLTAELIATQLAPQPGDAHLEASLIAACAPARFLDGAPLSERAVLAGSAEGVA